MVSAQSKVWLLCLLTATGSLRAEQTNGSNPEKNQTSSEGSLRGEQTNGSNPEKNQTSSDAKTNDRKALFWTPQAACNFMSRRRRTYDLVGELLPYLLDLEDFGYWEKRCQEERLANPSARPAYCPAQTETST